MLNNFLQNNVCVVVYNYCNFAVSIRLYMYKLGSRRIAIFCSNYHANSV